MYFNNLRSGNVVSEADYGSYKKERFSVENSLSKWFKPSCVSSSYSLIVGVKVVLKHLAPVVQRLDNAIHRINHYPVDSVVCFVKVHLTPKYFFRSNKSLHLFELHCAFLPRFNPNLDFLQAVKVTKSCHHLLHDRASKGYGSIPGLTSQTSLHACLQRLNTMQISL